MAKRRLMSPGLRKRLESSVRKSRRETLWRMAIKHNDGLVSCYVCGKAITKEKYATLEHILPVSKGGTDDMENLSLSHEKCNKLRGNENETN